MHIFLRNLSFPSQIFGYFGLDKVSNNKKEVAKNKAILVDTLNISPLSLIFPTQNYLISIKIMFYHPLH